MPEDLRRVAREIFERALAQLDAGDAVRRAVSLDGDQLKLADEQFDLRTHPVPVYSIALGKAAREMASALEEILGGRLAGGVVSAPASGASLSNRWRVYAGGHPAPDEASLAAARSSFELLRLADERRALVVFLVSGGGSAMLEWPVGQALTLPELREANRVLVSCGASIAEINTVRRALSAVKGGGLAARAPRASQVTLIVSDTGSGEEANVASGPTFPVPLDAPDASEVLARYDLAKRLPASVLRAVQRQGEQRSSVRKGDNVAPETVRRTATPERAGLSDAQAASDSTATTRGYPLRRHYVLLDNERALESAAVAARQAGLIVEKAHDLCEQHVAEGSAALVSRLVELRRRHENDGRAVCLISGGEFSCPVRGEGVGGRNAETALRCAVEMDARQTNASAARANAGAADMLVLSAGTDGIDGNSPSAGALADNTTLARASQLNLDPLAFLEASDAHTFFKHLGDTIDTGATGTNVRDLRICVAK